METRAPKSEEARATGAPRVLIVDDEKLIRWSLAQRLTEIGCEVVEAATGAQGIECFEHGVDLVLLDFRLPDVEGFSLLERMRASDADVPIIMLTAHASVAHARSAMRVGAHNYVPKPFDLDEVVRAAQRALESTRVRRKSRARGEGRQPNPSLESIVGTSAAIMEVKSLVARIARSPASTVLVTGESGTGKDLVARTLHAESCRASAPFMNITCSTLSSTLLESELFGHERGAFTDAKSRKKGLLEYADGGTVFLDEVGEMELALQVKLLRFLEEKTFRRVGGARDIQTDVRVVAATNVDMREAVHVGSFREDLYYRLAVLTVHIPPLRERIGDIPRLVTFLVEHFNREFGRKVGAVAPDALALLESHFWPGNVRELRNAIERAVLLARADTLTLEDFSMLGVTAVAPVVFRLPAGGVDVRELEKSLVEQALERSQGNQTRAAALLGMNRDQVRYRIESFGLALEKEPTRHE